MASKTKPVAVGWTAIACAAALCVANLFAAVPLLPQDGERKLWDLNLIKPEPRPQPGRQRPQSGNSSGKSRYKNKSPRVSTDAVVGDTVIGITVWKLIEPEQAPKPDEARLLVHEGDFRKEYTLKRIEADTPLSEGDRVRLSIEAARKGYLYVIDREEYADGTLSDPYLIFPIRSIRGGNNEVTPGRVIDIPSEEEKQNHFNLELKGDNQNLVGEALTVLVTPTPLRNLQIGDSHIKLPRELVEEWERNWGKKNVGQLELEKGAGASWKKSEQQAAASEARLLTHNDPPPQTIYYSPDAKLGEPMLIKVRLLVGKSR